ncbi:MAG: hypothetical protein HYV28_18810 [Ignavibacteriales bacterium]|nr:hypothetical protein [Ignavibacteriales bacterium]
MYKRLFVTLLCTVLLSIGSIYTFAQTTAGEDAKMEYRTLIDMTASGVLERGMVAVSNDVMPGGVLIARFEAGIFTDMNIGVSFGGANIIGSGSPRWYKLPAASLRYKLFNETLNMPQMTIGFDSQGKGEFIDSLDRYAIKSPGLFLAGSKNFAIFGYLTFHGSLNYSFENGDGDNFINMMVGAEKTLGSKVSLIGEYDFGFNDNGADSKASKGNGYLNIGVRWAPAEGITLGIDLRDMLSNKKWAPGGADRALKLEFIKKI